MRAGTDGARGAFTSPRPIHYQHARCVTVREMARLHGFPDWFRFHAAKWHGARQIGNAVPPPLARAIAAAVTKALGLGPERPAQPVNLSDTSYRYKAIIESIFFDHWQEGVNEFEFERREISDTAERLEIALPHNVGDVVYAIRYRTPLPTKVLGTQPSGLEWIIEGASRSRYRFKLVPTTRIRPNPGLESVSEDYEGLQSFRNMSRIDAKRRNMRAPRLRFAQSLASPRQRFNQAIVLSTIQRFGNFTNLSPDRIA